MTQGVLPVKRLVPPHVMSIYPMFANSTFPVKRTIFLVGEDLVQSKFPVRLFIGTWFPDLHDSHVFDLKSCMRKARDRDKKSKGKKIMVKIWVH